MEDEQMKKMICSILMLMGVLFGSVQYNVALAAESSETMDAKERLINIYQDFSAEQTALEMDIDIDTMLGKARLHTNMIGTNTTPFVGKAENSITFALLGQKSTEFQSTQYIEQVGDALRVYTFSDKKWVKQTIPNFKDISVENNLREQMNFVKSITIQGETEEAVDVTIVYDFDKVGEAIEKNLAEDKSIFKTAEEKQSFITGCKNVMHYIGEVPYTQHIDKKNKVITAELDVSDTIKKAAEGIMNEIPEMKELDKARVNQFLKDMTVKMQMECRAIDGGEKIKIPEEAIKQAKEIKFDTAKEKIDKEATKK